MKSPSNRRSILTQSALALGSAFSAPWIRAASKTDPTDGLVIGHGDFRYRVEKGWSKADAAKHPVRDCHEMVQAADGRLFLLTNEKANNVLVYNTDGTLDDAWTFGWSGAHGLTLHRDADGSEHLYATDTSGGRVVKASLSGDIELELPHPAKVGAYRETDAYRPTETAVGPNGDIYVADGYGSQWILRFDAKGNFISKFGGKSTQPVNAGKFIQAHGVALDTRGEESLLVCTARIRNEFHWFTLEGQFVRTVYLPGAYVSRPVISGQHLYSGVCFGTFENDFRMWQGRGFVTVLDDQDRVVSNPGGRAPEYRDGKLVQLIQDQPVFKNCHDVCVDRAGDLYACQWNSDRVYPFKLHRE
jgi:hypothetical protein